MLSIKRFDPTKTYMFPNGTLATPEAIRASFPAVDHFTHILEINGDVVQAVMSLKAVRGIHKVDESKTEDEAIADLELLFNTPAPIVVGPEERTAAALEFSNLMMLDDVQANTKDPLLLVQDDPYAKLLKQNFDRGLWSTQMLEKAHKKGVLSGAQLLDITVK